MALVNVGLHSGTENGAETEMQNVCRGTLAMPNRRGGRIRGGFPWRKAPDAPGPRFSIAGHVVNKRTPTRRVFMEGPDCEDVVRDVQTRLQSVLSSEVDAIVVIDRKGAIESVNPAFTRMFGYSPEEVLGGSVGLLMPEPYRSEHDRYIGRYLRTGEPRIIGVGREVEGRRKDGTTFPITLAVSEMRLGSRRMFTGVVRDISLCKLAADEARRAEERSQQYLDIAPVMIIALDAAGTVTLINRKGCELLGYEESDVLGRDWFSAFLVEEERDRVRSVFDRILQGELATVEYYENVVVSKNGGRIPVAWHNTWLRDDEGTIVGTLSSGVDLTETKRLTKRLIEKESLARLGELSAIVAHEVKNPLAGIVGAARMLKQRLPEGELCEIVEELISRAEALNDGVKDILAYSRPRSPDLRAVQLRAVVEDVVAFVAHDPRFASVEVDLIGESPPALCDPEMLKPVFLNLFVNAAQAMDGSGRIRVRVERGDRCCTITVHDTGPGIPSDTRERIFEPFFTTKGGGTGLGLPIAKRTMELHGGSIALDCPADGGTNVTIEIPVATDEAPE